MLVTCQLDDGDTDADSDGTIEMTVSSDQPSTSTQSMSLERQESTTVRERSEKQGSMKVVKRSLSFENLEYEFVKAVRGIKEALCRNRIDAYSLAYDLSMMTAVKEKKVPLFNDNAFEEANTIEELWKILRTFFSILDYDVLIFVVNLAECKEAEEILNEFLLKVDSAPLRDAEFVLQYKEYDTETIKPLLRIKVREKKCTPGVIKKAKKIIAEKFDIEKYALRFKSIREGCIELLFEISNAVMSYLLQCKVTGYDMAKFALHNILCIQIDDKKLIVPSNLGNMVSIIS